VGCSPYDHFYDDYDLKGVDSFRQLKISVESPNASAPDLSRSLVLQLVNLTTGAILASGTSLDGKLVLDRTALVGSNYKIRVADTALGDYKISVADGGKATSIVSSSRSIKGYTSALFDLSEGVGTVGENGAYFPLASSYIPSQPLPLSDIALSSNGQFYGITSLVNSNILYKIDPSLDRLQQVTKVNEATTGIKDPQGKDLTSNLSALEFGADQKLYAIGTGTTGGKLFQIDVNTSVATSIADLPVGLNGSGDLVYVAASNSFFAVAEDTATSDALWKIPLANPSGATKIGQVGFTGVRGINLENGQLTGFTVNKIANNTEVTGNRITINASNGIGTIGSAISTEDYASIFSLGSKTTGINGASTIIAPTTPTTQTTPTTPINPINPITPITPTFPTSTVDAIGTKNQTLTNRTIDLTNYKGQTLKVDTVTKGDAAYTNNVGFYAVQDAIGTIKLADGSTLKPGDANYAVEAIRSAILQAGKIDSKLGRDIAGGEIYAPVVVAQGSFNDFVSKNPTNGGDGTAIHAYFNYIGANTDKFDHFKLIAPNTFAVEDQYGGGDRDFNDLVVNMNVKI
jgi:Domain of unknown function (DUF4114)